MGRDRRGGFTLVELLIVVAIFLGTLSLIAFAIRAQRGYSGEGASHSLSLLLNRARSEAIANLSDVTVEFRGKANAWNQVIAFIDEDKDNTLDDNEQEIGRLDLGEKAVISAITLVHLNGEEEQIDEDTFSGLSYSPLGLPRVSGERFKEMIIVVQGVEGENLSKPFSLRLTSGGKVLSEVPVIVESVSSSGGSEGDEEVGSGGGDEDNSSDDRCIVITLPREICPPYPIWHHHGHGRHHHERLCKRNPKHIIKICRRKPIRIKPPIRFPFKLFVK